MTATTTRIAFTVPLPLPELRANNRAHWAKRKAAADWYATWVWASVNDVQWDGEPWQRAKVTYTWRYCGAKPDHSNLGGNTKYLQDILCVAPKLAPKVKYTRWHLGIVENDQDIEATFKLEKVAHRADECVLVEIERC